MKPQLIKQKGRAKATAQYLRALAAPLGDRNALSRTLVKDGLRGNCGEHSDVETEAKTGEPPRVHKSVLV